MMMGRWGRLSAVLIGCIAVAGTAGCGLLGRGSAAVRSNGAAPGTVTTVPINWHAPYDPDEAAQRLKFWEQRSLANPKGQIDRCQWAEAGLDRYRETGDVAYAARAESAARQSLSILSKHNAAAWTLLGRSLLAQHKFKAALAAAKYAAAGDVDANRLLADIYPELGDYSAAERAVLAIPHVRNDPNYLALRAHLLQIKGHAAEALSLLREAQAQADRDSSMPAVRVAWYHLHTGKALAAMGRMAEADRAYSEAVHLFPRDAQAMAALARSKADQRDWKECVKWGQRAAAITPSPEVVALLGDAYSALGKKRQASDQYRLVEAIATVSRTKGVYDRQRAVYLCDHHAKLGEALSLARRELGNRRDIYTYDTLAWACYNNHLLKDAAANIKRAMAQGTQDAVLYYHAGKIAAAQGDKVGARRCLSRAREINPGLRVEG